MSLFEPRTDTVHVYTGDYLARLAELHGRIEEAADDATPQRSGAVTAPARLVKEYKDLLAEAKAKGYAVTLQQLGRRQAKELRKAHPPRVAGKNGATERQAATDAMMGVNEETFTEALVLACVCSVTRDGEPQDFAEDDLLDMPGEGTFGRMYRVALDLNYGYVDPKESDLDSLTTPQSAATSS